jgi:hypothetical protein
MSASQLTRSSRAPSHQPGKSSLNFLPSRSATRTREPLITGQLTGSWPGLSVPVTSISKILSRSRWPPTSKHFSARPRRQRPSSTWRPSGCWFPGSRKKTCSAMNPAREVKTERFSRTEGKTPAFVEGEVQRLPNAIETSTHTGPHDRALLGVLAYTFARIAPP